MELIRDSQDDGTFIIYTHALAMSPDGKSLFFAGGPRKLGLLRRDMATGQETALVDGRLPRSHCHRMVVSWR